MDGYGKKINNERLPELNKKRKVCKEIEFKE